MNAGVWVRVRGCGFLVPLRQEAHLFSGGCLIMVRAQAYSTTAASSAHWVRPLELCELCVATQSWVCSPGQLHCWWWAERRCYSHFNHLTSVWQEVQRAVQFYRLMSFGASMAGRLWCWMLSCSLDVSDMCPLLWEIVVCGIEDVFYPMWIKLPIVPE